MRHVLQAATRCFRCVSGRCASGIQKGSVGKRRIGSTGQHESGKRQAHTLPQVRFLATVPASLPLGFLQLWMDQLLVLCRTNSCQYNYTVAFLLLYLGSISCEPPTAAVRSPARPAAFAPSVQAIELDLLNTLGWQHMYDPSGYSIDASLPSNCSLATWASLGSLHKVTNLTLNGNLPDLPDSWASNGSFPSLLAMNFSVTDLGGSLPSSWSSSSAFPHLSTLSFNATQLSGTLPEAWGQPGSFPKLTELYLDHTDITGATQLSVLRYLSLFS